MNLIDKVLQEELLIEDTHTIIDSDVLEVSSDNAPSRA